jgi:hypothetical protein
MNSREDATLRALGWNSSVAKHIATYAQLRRSNLHNNVEAENASTGCSIGRIILGIFVRSYFDGKIWTSYPEGELHREIHPSELNSGQTV